MARTALKAKQWKMFEKRFVKGEKLEQPTKYYNRCRLCGRSKAYIRRLVGNSLFYFMNCTDKNELC